MANVSSLRTSAIPVITESVPLRTAAIPAIPLITLVSVNEVPQQIRRSRNPIYAALIEKLKHTVEGQALRFDKPAKLSKSSFPVSLRKHAKQAGFQRKIFVAFRSGTVYVWSEIERT